MSSEPNILVLGSGFGGLEAAFYLRMRLPEEADITVISDKREFLFKPNTIYIPFGLDPEKLKIKLEAPLRRKRIGFVEDVALEIDPQRKRVHTEHYNLPYDYLVVATGAGMRTEEIPGLEAYANTIWTPEEMLGLRNGLRGLVETARQEQRQKVLFVVPPGNKCSGPLYEIVFMLDTWLRRQGVRDLIDITWTTFERSYIQAFGPRLNEVVMEEFSRRRISGLREWVVNEVRNGHVIYEDGQRLPFDLLISFPPYVAATTFPGLPSDERGFIHTELATRQVVGHPDIYAVGDAADFPVKQAFLAFLQADAAAEHLAARVLGEQAALAFDPVSMCVMEQFDKATFAQVPLELTGVAEQPIRVRAGAEDLYKVGSGPAWRAGKKLLGVYLPWRFGAGEPFHAGLPWKGMEVGLKMMSGLLAE